MSIAAVVVSFNRRDLLAACLEGLISQTLPLDEIIVVDNGSTDGSPEMVAERFPGVSLFRSHRNVGGAGGFAIGIDLAMAHGHSAAWLMDDDAEPEAGALAPLVAAMSAGPALSFVASTVTDHDGNVLPDHLPQAPAGTTPEVAADAVPPGAVPAAFASFVGVLVNLDLARKEPLPFADFFIWFDDFEYTSRLALKAPGCYVKDSVVRHPRKPRVNVGPRVHYLVRNKIWLARLSHLRGGRGRVEHVRAAVGLVLRQLKEGRRPFETLWYAGKGALEGVRRRPSVRWPGDLVHAAQRE